mmetsp:Transcript_41972/g.125587  ORF Transcript_41972/g.125587 Transcript_41972/m.125587 type:complete len:226 (+) Transcript_41972:1419-2096(+)
MQRRAAARVARGAEVAVVPPQRLQALHVSAGGGAHDLRRLGGAHRRRAHLPVDVVCVDGGQDLPAVLLVGGAAAPHVQGLQDPLDGPPGLEVRVVREGHVVVEAEAEGEVRLVDAPHPAGRLDVAVQDDQHLAGPLQRLGKGAVGHRLAERGLDVGVLVDSEGADPRDVRHRERVPQGALEGLEGLVPAVRDEDAGFAEAQWGAVELGQEARVHGGAHGQALPQS